MLHLAGVVPPLHDGGAVVGEVGGTVTQMGWGHPPQAGHRGLVGREGGKGAYAAWQWKYKLAAKTTLSTTGHRP